METSPDRTRRSGGHARSGPLLRARDADAGPPRHRAPVATAREGTRVRPGRVSPVALLVGGAGAAAVLAVSVAVVVGGDDTPVASSPATPRASAAATPTAASAVPLPSADAGSSPAVVAATGPGRTAADARSALEQQLSARADANLALLRATWERDAAGAARAAQALAASSAGLAAVVTAWEDAPLATLLRTGLDGQSEASRDYAAAVAADDLPAADRARAEMADVSRGLGDVLDSVTDGRIAAYVPPQDAAHYRAYVDALEAGDAEAADEAAGWLRARMVREGAALALGLS